MNRRTSVKLWDIGPTLIYARFLPPTFSCSTCGICRTYLPYVFAVRICRTYLPYVLAVRTCRTWPYDLRLTRSHAKYGSCRSRDLRRAYIKPSRAHTKTFFSTTVLPDQ